MASANDIALQKVTVYAIIKYNYTMRYAIKFKYIVFVDIPKWTLTWLQNRIQLQ